MRGNGGGVCNCDVDGDGGGGSVGVGVVKTKQSINPIPLPCETLLSPVSVPRPLSRSAPRPSAHTRDDVLYVKNAVLYCLGSPKDH